MCMSWITILIVLVLSTCIWYWVVWVYWVNWVNISHIHPFLLQHRRLIAHRSSDSQLMSPRSHSENHFRFDTEDISQTEIVSKRSLELYVNNSCYWMTWWNCLPCKYACISIYIALSTWIWLWCNLSLDSAIKIAVIQTGKSVSSLKCSLNLCTFLPINLTISNFLFQTVLGWSCHCEHVMGTIHVATP